MQVIVLFTYGFIMYIFCKNLQFYVKIDLGDIYIYLSITAYSVWFIGALIMI